MSFLSFLVGLALAIAIAIWLFIRSKGDCNFEFLVDQRTPFSLVELKENHALFACHVPFINNGTQDGTLIDVHIRALLPKEQYDKVDVDARLNNTMDPRDDHYWEAVIIPMTTGGSVRITVKLTATQGDIQSALADMVDMPMYIVYEVVGRRPIVVYKTYMELTQEETRGGLKQGQAA